MAKRVRYSEGNPIPVRIEYKENGASRDEPMLSSEEAAAKLGVAKKTLVRWWRKVRFPGEEYEPNEEYRGAQMRLLWPASVVAKIGVLLDGTSDVAGLPGQRRLPEVPWKAGKKW